MLCYPLQQIRHAILCNAAKTVHMDIVTWLILYSNKNFRWFIIFIKKQALNLEDVIHMNITKWTFVLYHTKQRGMHDFL